MACVRQRENSGSYRDNQADADGRHHGAYQFDDETWAAAWRGHPPTANAASATPRQQDQGFERWYPSNPGAWAQTAPLCA